MDFIESFFHVSPDGGSGITEATCLIAMLAVVVAPVFRESIRRAVQWRPRR
jgi:hypothetical protein